MHKLENVDIDKLVSAVRRIAKAHPDFVYKDKIERTTDYVGPTCFYARNGQGSCIMGKALLEIGFTIADLEAMDEDSAGIGTFLFPDYPRAEDDDRIWWLGEVQSHQDYLDPWGTAIELADATFPGV